MTLIAQMESRSELLMNNSLLERARRIHSEHFPALGAVAVACSEGEIEALEFRMGLRLPAAYREFLRWMGKGDGRFWIGLGGFYEGLPRYNEWARDMLRESGTALALPPDAFVIFWDDNHFFFLRASEGVDPPIYAFLRPGLEELVRQVDSPAALSPNEQYLRYVFENVPRREFAVRADRYSDFLVDELLEHVRIVTNRMARGQP